MLKGKSKEFVFTKGVMKGRRWMIVDIPSSFAGNEVLIKTSKRQYWINKDNLENRVRWLQLKKMSKKVLDIHTDKMVTQYFIPLKEIADKLRYRNISVGKYGIFVWGKKRKSR